MQTCLLLGLFLAVFVNLSTQPLIYKYILLISSSSWRLYGSWYCMNVSMGMMSAVEILRVKTI